MKIIQEANRPEDVFGSEPFKSVVRRKYFSLLHQVHPDKWTKGTKEEQQLANDLTVKLNLLYAEAIQRIDKNIYGTKEKLKEESKDIIIKTKKYTYKVIKKIHEGKLSIIYLATLFLNKDNSINKKVILKIVNSKNDNDLLENEFNNIKLIKNHILKSFKDKKTQDDLIKLFPHSLENIKVSERSIHVYNHEEGWYTLEEIHNKHKNLDPRIAVFILNRILNILMLAHEADVFHGNIKPSHILVHAESHKVNILDWTHTKDKKLIYLDKSNTTYIAPEILNKKLIFKSSDIYSAAMCIVYLFGGIDNLRNDIPTEFISFLNKCLQPSSKNRFKDAFIAFEEFGKVSHTIYGKPKFVELNMK